MPNKTQEYLNLAQQTAKELTRYWENWTDYLTTASRLYKYSYADQLMIYAQRPDATACASFDLWNNRMNRYVRHGSKGIALLDQSSSVPRLHYVFDVSDTGCAAILVTLRCGSSALIWFSLCQKCLPENTVSGMNESPSRSRTFAASWWIPIGITTAVTFSTSLTARS